MPNIDNENSSEKYRIVMDKWQKMKDSDGKNYYRCSFYTALDLKTADEITHADAMPYLKMSYPPFDGKNITEAKNPDTMIYVTEEEFNDIMTRGMACDGEGSSILFNAPIDYDVAGNHFTPRFSEIETPTIPFDIVKHKGNTRKAMIKPVEPRGAVKGQEYNSKSSSFTQRALDLKSATDIDYAQALLNAKNDVYGRESLPYNNINKNDFFNRQSNISSMDKLVKESSKQLDEGSYIDSDMRKAYAEAVHNDTSQKLKERLDAMDKKLDDPEVSKKFLRDILRDKTDFSPSYKDESFIVILSHAKDMHEVYFDGKDEVVKKYRKSQEMKMISDLVDSDPYGKNPRTQLALDMDALFADNTLSMEQKVKYMKKMLEDYAEKSMMDSAMYVKMLDDDFNATKDSHLLSDVLKASPEARKKITELTGRDASEFEKDKTFAELESDYKEAELKSACDDIKGAIYVLNLKYAYTSKWNTNLAQRRVATRVFGDPAVKRVLEEMYGNTVRDSAEWIKSTYGTDTRKGETIHAYLNDDPNLPYGDDNTRYLNGVFSVEGFEHLKDREENDIEKEKELIRRRPDNPGAAARSAEREIIPPARPMRPLPTIELEDEDEDDLDGPEVEF